jgi:ABC-type antimicrobial peptide transport system permease subunit
VINEAMATRIWPGQNPVGQLVTREKDAPPLRVVGVVRNARYYRIDQDYAPFFFFPLAQFPDRDMTLLIRSSIEPAALDAAVRAAMAEVDKVVVLSPLRSLQQLAHAQSAGLRASANLTTAFGLLAFVLAIMGIVVVVSFGTAQRMREVGIRLTLGAKPRDILVLLARPTLISTACALLVGAPLSILAVRTITKTMRHVQAADPRVMMLVILTLGAASALTALLPARRALNIQPRHILSAD